MKIRNRTEQKGRGYCSSSAIDIVMAKCVYDIRRLKDSVRKVFVALSQLEVSSCFDLLVLRFSLLHRSRSLLTHKHCAPYTSQWLGVADVVDLQPIHPISRDTAIDKCRQRAAVAEEVVQPVTAHSFAP